MKINVHASISWEQIVEVIAKLVLITDSFNKKDVCLRHAQTLEKAAAIIRRELMEIPPHIDGLYKEYIQVKHSPEARGYTFYGWLRKVQQLGPEESTKAASYYEKV